MLWLYESFFPVVWIAFLLYWQIKATDTKTTQRLEPATSRILRVLTFLIAIVLLSTTRIPLRWLYLPLWPSDACPTRMRGAWDHMKRNSRLDFSWSAQ